MNHVGKTTLAYVDFADPGGMNTMSRLTCPRATSSRWPSSRRWWAATVVSTGRNIHSSGSSVAGLPGISTALSKSIKDSRARVRLTSSAAALAGNTAEVIVAHFLDPARLGLDRPAVAAGVLVAVGLGEQLLAEPDHHRH